MASADNGLTDGAGITATGTNTFLSGASVTFNSGTTLTVNGTVNMAPTGGTWDLTPVAVTLGNTTISTLNVTAFGSGTLLPANGGTGAASLTANNIILGNGASAVTFLAPGTSGNVVTSDGTAWVSSAPAAGDGVPGGVGALWPTSGVGSPPTGYFEAGLYGTTAQTALGAWSIIVKSLGTVANPTVDVPAGAVATGTVVTFSSATSGAFFTTTNNTTDPTYTVGTSGGNWTISGNQTIEVRANKAGYVSSGVESFAYTIDDAPTLTNAVIDGTTLTLTFSEAVVQGAAYSDAHLDLDMSSTGSNIGVTYASGNNTTTHVYTAASAAVAGETVDIDFTGTANSLEDGSGNDLAAISSAAVTNSTSGSSLLTDLVSYWKLDEASGTRFDAHGTNDLTDNNTVGSNTGKISDAASFVIANSEYLSRASNSTLQLGDIDWTIQAWVYVPSSSPNQAIVAKDDDAASSRDYTLDSQSSRFRIYFDGGGAGKDAQTSTNFNINTWYHIVAQHDATANTLTIRQNNGTPVSTSTSGPITNVSSSEFRIGAREYSGAEIYSGARIDEVAIWKRKLTSDEITELYNSGSGKTYPFTP